MGRMQKQNGAALGWFPTKQFEGYVDQGNALVAECDGRVVGHVLSRDSYSGRTDVGAIYQVAVDSEYRRQCVAAAMVAEVFRRAAYGCRLFCCWCAQDLEGANRFWESLGFVPIAFRTGGRGKLGKGKPRQHVFWQARVRAGDDHPWWYPHQTKNGAMREDRLVFPIPPGTRWSDAVPVVLPEEARPPAGFIEAEQKRLGEAKQSRRKPRVKEAERPRMSIIVRGKIKWVDRPASSTSPTPPPVVAEEPIVKEKPAPRKVLKHEKAAIAFCRELRDRWAERVAEEPHLIAADAGKYAVALPSAGGVESLPMPARRALPAAA